MEKYPTITFTSTKVAKGGKGKLEVHGDLTIRGVTKPVALDVEWPDLVVALGDTAKRGATATTTINRKDFGIKWNQTFDGGVTIAEKVKILIELELDKKVAEKKQAAKK